MDPYVRLTLFDAASGGTEAFRTTTQMNDASPRWEREENQLERSLSHSEHKRISQKPQTCGGTKTFRTSTQMKDASPRWIRVVS